MGLASVTWANAQTLEDSTAKFNNMQDNCDLAYGLLETRHVYARQYLLSGRPYTAPATDEWIFNFGTEEYLIYTGWDTGGATVAMNLTNESVPSVQTYKGICNFGLDFHQNRGFFYLAPEYDYFSMFVKGKRTAIVDSTYERHYYNFQLILHKDSVSW